MTPIPKGSIIMPVNESWWYVVVNQDSKGGVNCICDNANNIYYFPPEEIDPGKVFTPYQAMRENSWGHCHEKLEQLKVERSIPVEVIAEVLADCHNDRFDHWSKK